MTIAAQVEAVIARLPAIREKHPEMWDFWREVDAAMEPITAAVETDQDQVDLDSRYSDLMAKADIMGMCQPE